MENRQEKTSREDKDALIAKYKLQLSEQQLKALELAQNHLGLSKMCCAA